MPVKRTFLVLFIATMLALDGCVIYCTAKLSSLVLVHTAIFLVMNIGVAYGLSELILSLRLAKRDLPKLERLECMPKVALLYATYNDVMPEILDALHSQSYSNCDIFVLDDSTDKRCRLIVDACGFPVIRRSSRSGFKAGALNNWLSLYGRVYDYFIILDADSLIGQDFIEEMLRYAEHPSNGDVAIFQSKINSWNQSTRFARILSSTTPFASYINDRIANECETVLSWGHNNLHRVSHLMEVGGFDTRYVCEDYATAINLINRGYKCRLVDVISYEMQPGTVQIYTKRNVRWAKQNLELLKLDVSGLSFNTRLHIYMSIYYYSMWMVYFLGIFLVTYGYSSSYGDIFNLINDIAPDGRPDTPSIASIMFLLYNINFLVLRLPLACRLGISVRDYFRNLILLLAVSYYMMIDIIKAQIKTILGCKVTFDVTEKTDSKIPFMDTLRDFRGTNMFIVIIILGLVKNPLALIYNFTWLAPLLASSMIIYLVQMDRPASSGGLPKPNAPGQKSALSGISPGIPAPIPTDLH